jgi:hypothetical protein
MIKKWKNKVGYGQNILLENGNKIKIVTWYRYDFIEMELMDKKGKTIIGVLAYSENEIQQYIESFKIMEAKK